MTLLSFLVTVAWWPGFLSTSNDPRWLLLSLTLPWLWRGRLSWPIGLFLAWAALTLIWGPLWDGLDRLWRLILLGLAFQIGMEMGPERFRQCLAAFGVGIAINACLALAWIAGLHWPDQPVPPAGLFANKNYLGEAAVMAVAAPLTAPFALTAIVVTQGHGPLLALWLVILWRWRRVGLALGVVGFIAALSVIPQKATTEIRLAYWSNSMAAILDQPWGHGVGSYWSVYPFYHDAVMPTPPDGGYSESQRPRTAHNDALTIAVELGLPGLALLSLILIRCLSVPKRRESYILVAFVGCGLTGFPLFNPTTGFLGALAAGRLYRDWRDLRSDAGDRRKLLPRRDLRRRSDRSDVVGQKRPSSLPAVPDDPGGRRFTCDADRRHRPGSGIADHRGRAS